MKRRGCQIYAPLQEKLPSKSPALLGLRDKAFNIAKNPKFDRYQRGLASMVYKFFDKKLASGSDVANNEIKQNLQLAEELQKTNY